MKAVLFNGSPRRNGNTAALLACVGRTLEANGWEVETVHLGKANIHGCRGCQACARRLDGHCAFGDDDCNAMIDKIMASDAVVMGSPCYFTDVTAELKGLIDRAGYVAFVNKWMFSGKIGAAVIAAGRAGATHAYDTINHMYLMNNMLVPGSVYWNVGFGQKPGEAVENDAFTVQTMEQLGRAIAWLGACTVPRIGEYPR